MSSYCVKVAVGNTGLKLKENGNLFLVSSTLFEKKTAKIVKTQENVITMKDYCSGCLSTHRKLTLLNSVATQTDLKLLKLNWKDRDLICWECKAKISNFMKFKEQVTHAHNIIKLWKKSNKNQRKPHSLSKLSFCTKIKYDYTIEEDENYRVKQERKVVLTEETSRSIKNEDLEETSDVVILVLKNEADSFNIEADEVHDDFDDAEHKSTTNGGDIKDSNSVVVKQETKFIDKLRYSEKSADDDFDEEEKKPLKPPKKKVALSTRSWQYKLVKEPMTQKELEDELEEARRSHRYRTCPYKCESCVTAYFTEAKYRRHLEVKHRNGDPNDPPPQRLERFRCRRCDYAHHSIRRMLVHYDNAHSMENWPCKDCDRAFTKPTQLRYHRERDHKEFKCDVCDRKLTTSYGLKIHMRVHTGHPKKQCPECGGWYSQLNAHLRTHSNKGVESAYCAECDKQFRNETTYRNHVTYSAKHRTGDTEERLKYKCPYCGYRCCHKTALTVHVHSRHENKHRFTCHHCGKGFHRRDRLKIHITEIHEGIERPKSNICDICGRAFKEKRVLKNHILVHTGARPHQCQHCPWSFTQRTTLVTHMKSKHKDKLVDK